MTCNRLVRLRLHFLAHALEAASACLQVGDADHVFVAHPQCEQNARFVESLYPSAAWSRFTNLLEAVQVELA